MKTKIFLDSSDPESTQRVIDALGQLDGQTTNPSLVTKIPVIQQLLLEGKRIPEKTLLSLYREHVEKISEQIPHGSVSIEVYADEYTTAEEILHQAEEFYTWIPNAHIKFPTIKSGLEAGKIWVEKGGRANFTLIFSQQQARAIADICSHSLPGQVFVSPFLGRLLDINVNGYHLLRNILEQFKKSASNVEVLAASVRTIEQLQLCLSLKVDIITAPEDVLTDWAAADKPRSVIYKDVDFLTFDPVEYEPIEYKSLYDLDITHPLTTKGLNAFTTDWKKIIE